MNAKIFFQNLNFDVSTVRLFDNDGVGLLANIFKICSVLWFMFVLVT